MPRKTKEIDENKLKKSSKKEETKTTKKAKASASKTKKTTKKVDKKVTSSKSTKKATAKKTTTKKAAAKRKTTTTNSKSIKVETKKNTGNIVEYYDLPYRYNQTIVKLLAQTPTTLFIYWDISDEDRKRFEEQYGSDFFQNTKPILVVHNDTLNYSFEVEINDFANSWYLHVTDSKCDYRIELGRRPIIKTDKLKDTNYIYVTTSNEIESPNDRVLINKEQKMVYFRNVKTNATTSKPLKSLSFMRNMGKIYNVYDLYKTFYKTEHVEEIYDLNNPSSHPSSRI